MEISETKYEALCRNSQRLDTICDFILESAARGYEHITLELAAALTDIPKEYRQAVDEAKKEANDEQVG